MGNFGGKPGRREPSKVVMTALTGSRDMGDIFRVLNAGQTSTSFLMVGLPVESVEFSYPTNDREDDKPPAKIRLSSVTIGGSTKIVPLYQRLGRRDPDDAGRRAVPIICVVDCTNRSKPPGGDGGALKNSGLRYYRDELNTYFLENGDAFEGSPILFLLAKQGEAGAAPTEQVVREMDLSDESLGGRRWRPMSLPSPADLPEEARATVLEGLGWLLGDDPSKLTKPAEE